MSFTFKERAVEFVQLLKVKPRPGDFLAGAVALLAGRHVTRLSPAEGIRLEAPPNAFLVHIVKEVFVNRCYEQGGVQLGENNTVVDIGANIGVFSVCAGMKTGGKVFSFEPFPENFEYLNRNINANGLGDKVISFRKAVAAERGESKMVVSRSSGGHLLDNSDITRAFRDEERVIVETVTLDDVFGLAGIDHIDLLKIDCEGSEGAIIRDLTKERASRIGSMAMEYHDDASVLNHEEIRQKLESLGYTVTVAAHQTSPYGFVYARMRKG